VRRIRQLPAGWLDPVVVTVVVGEADPAVQRAGGGVAAGDLQVDVHRTTVGRVRGQRCCDGGAQAAAPVLRVHFDRGQAGPLIVAGDPPDGDRLAVGPANACHGAELSTFRATGGSCCIPR